MITILTPEEMAFAQQIALSRQQVQRGANRRDGKVLADSVDIDVQGCLAELATSKVLGLPWDGKFFNDAEWQIWRTEGHDVSGLEVRSTRHRSGRLILHPKDKDGVPFVLVRGISRYDQISEVCVFDTYEVVGWIWGQEGKNPEWWEEGEYGRPCYYVPNHKLNSVGQLFRLLKSNKNYEDPDLVGLFD